MYCPKRGCEYREGFFECSDCKKPLVSGKPPEEKIESINFKEVTTNLKQDAPLSCPKKLYQLMDFFRG